MNEKMRMYVEKTFEMAKETGWAIPWGEMKNGKVVRSPAANDDELWSQGFYGIFLGLAHQSGELDVIDQIDSFVRGIEVMLLKTNGIFLRCNADYYINGHNHEGYTAGEASKDQMVGMTAALTMIFCNIEDRGIKMRIKAIINHFNSILVKHWWCLYIDSQKRYYNSAVTCFQHYYGLSKAFDLILGVCRPRNILMDIFGTLYALTLPLGLLAKADLSAKTGFVQNPIIQWLIKKFPKFMDGLLDPAEYGVGLYFYEMLMAGMSSKKKAQDIVKILDTVNVKRLKHYSLSSLRQFLVRKWLLKNDILSDVYHNMVVLHDEYIFPEKIIPNAEANGCFFPINPGGGWWPIDSVCQFFPDRNFDLTFRNDWIQSPPEPTKETEQIADGKYVDPGVCYLSRRFMITYGGKK